MAMGRTRLIVVLIFIFLPVFSWASFEGLINSPALKEAWESVRTDRIFKARKILSAYKPEPESLAMYHFIYAKTVENPLDAIEHLRWAYLYSTEDELKELALLQRADTYLELGYFQEARSDYLIFIKTFPASRYIKEAHKGLAKALMRLGVYREAIEHYEKAGDTPESLFGKANALQQLGLVKEAAKAYEKAMSRYKGYILSSDEALYYYGKNLRARGRLSEARKYLASVKGASYRDRAEICLGQIAMTQGRINEAIDHFSSALYSSSRDVRRTALLNLALAQIKAGRFQEAKANLEEIRYNYPYGKGYDEAILRLSRLYSREGDYTTAVSLLKELVFRLSPVKEALDEFEAILMEVKEKDTAQFIKLWKSVGPWLLDRSREKTLIEVADALKPAGEPFLEVSDWLLKHGSPRAKARSLTALTTYYAEVGDIKTAKKYLEEIKAIKRSSDDVFRAEAKVFYASGDFKSAAEKLLLIKELSEEDLSLLADTLTSAKDIKKAIEFYEKALRKVRVKEAEDYIALADVLYEQGEKAEALKYYKLSLEKEPDNEWVLYRIGVLSDRKEAERIFKKIGENNSVIGRLASARLKEFSVVKRMEEMF
jgi:tetratricopeptide (TPR) repeat protein